MDARITEIGRTVSTAYGVAFYLCGNAEVIASQTSGEHDESGNGWSDAAAAASVAAAEILTDAGYDYERVTSFAAYNGGPLRRLVEPVYFVAEIMYEECETVLGDWIHTWQRGAGATLIPAEVGVADVEHHADQAEKAMAAAMLEASEASARE